MADPLHASDPFNRPVLHVGIFAGMLIGTALGLRWLDRIIWCNCGGWTPWSWDIWSSHNSQHLIDHYFFSHVLHGLIFYGALRVLWPLATTVWRFHLAVLIEAGWELLENSPIVIERYRDNTIAQDYLGDSIANSSCDMLACALGFYLALRLRTVYTVMLFLAIEVLMTLLIRDCLILNVLMLLWPVDSIAEWQSSR